MIPYISRVADDEYMRPNTILSQILVPTDISGRSRAMSPVEANAKRTDNRVIRYRLRAGELGWSPNSDIIDHLKWNFIRFKKQPVRKKLHRHKALGLLVDLIIDKASDISDHPSQMVDVTPSSHDSE